MASSIANCSFWRVASGPRSCASSGKNTDFLPSIATFFFQPPCGLASAGGAVCSFATGASGKVSVATARWATTGEPPKMRAAKLENRETNTQRATALDFLTDEDPPGSAVSSTNLVPPRWSFSNRTSKLANSSMRRSVHSTCRQRPSPPRYRNYCTLLFYVAVLSSPRR
jgi:hypothetical protein